MTPRLFPALILVAAFTGPAFAQTAPHQHDHPTTASSGADINVPAAAKDAVATVDRFSAALSSGDLAKAGKELDPNVLILERGVPRRPCQVRCRVSEDRTSTATAPHCPCQR